MTFNWKAFESYLSVAFTVCKVFSHGLLPHLSAHTTLSAALGISQWAYPSLEVCTDENRKKKKEKKESVVWWRKRRADVRLVERWREKKEGKGKTWNPDGGDEWERRCRLMAALPPLSPGCGCDSSRKNVRMGRLVRRDVDGREEGACMHV